MEVSPGDPGEQILETSLARADGRCDQSALGDGQRDHCSFSHANILREWLWNSQRQAIAPLLHLHSHDYPPSCELVAGGDGEERDWLDAVVSNVVFQLRHVGRGERMEELLVALA